MYAATSVATDEDGETVNFADLLADAGASGPDDTIVQRDEIQTVLRLLDAIDEREARVLRLRFGLDGKEPLTLKQIGVEIGLTRERVRQIEVEALRKLNQRLADERPSRFYGRQEPVEEEQQQPRRRTRKRKRAAS
jgi:RNA polymerase primary sigma factor